jgi:hypothetical protein
MSSTVDTVRSFLLPETRVARWYIFIQKIPNLGTFVSVLELKLLVCFIIICNILWPFVICYSPFVKFVVLWSIFPVLVCFTKKNMATLPETGVQSG